MYRITNWQTGPNKPAYVLATSHQAAMELFIEISGMHLAILNSKESPAPAFPDEMWFEMSNGHRFMVSKV